MKHLSIKKKLYFMILVVLIPMIIYQVFDVATLFEENVEVELKSNEDFAEAVGVSFTNYLDRLWDTELSMGIAVCNNKVASRDEIGQYMNTVLENQPTIKQYSWVDPSSLEITASSNEDAINVSLFGRQYIDEILKGGSKSVSNMVISRVYDKPTFIVARGIRENGVLKGIITANINVNELGLVLPSSRATGYKFFGLLDKQGVFVYRNGVPDIAAKMISDKENSDVNSALKGKIVKIKKYLSPITGKDMIGVNLPIKESGWVAFANTSYDEVFMRSVEDIRSHLLILLVIIILGLFLSIRIGNQILSPITVLQSAAREMSNGNLNIRSNITGKDEIALAAQAFDQMADSIEQYDVLKTQFFSNISHELKTPLNIILASIQMIESRHPVSTNCEVYSYTAKYMSMMRQNCYRLLRLINNLIDITRLDSGFLKVNLGNYNIVSVVEDIVGSVADFSESKGISLIFDTEVEEKIIACDPDKIERIVLNLLSNSIKFTPSGGSILVNIYSRDDRVDIKVRDTGIGIPHDKLVMVFERFRQVDSSLQREYEGSGIGLSLVKALVEAHKGKVSVESEYGHGTEVTIELPAVVAAKENIDMKNALNNPDIDKVHRINIEFSDIYS